VAKVIKYLWCLLLNLYYMYILYTVYCNVLCCCSCSGPSSARNYGVQDTDEREGNVMGVEAVSESE
jgi:hypothetical protein